MVPKCELFENIPLHFKELNYKNIIYKLEDHVGEKALNLNLLPKLKPAKRTLLTCFPNYLLKNVLVEYAFPYALSFH
jgi:hypothetical protein